MSAQPDFGTTQPALKLSEFALLQLALEQLPDDYAILSTEFKVEWIAPRFAQRLGIELATACSLNWFDVHPIAGRRRSEYESVAAGATREFPSMPARGAGGLRLYQTRLQPLRVGATVSAVLVCDQDVTDKVLDPNVAARRRALVATLPEGSDEAIVLLDADGCVQAVSASITTLLGYAAENLIGKPVFGATQPEDLADARSRLTDGSLLRDPLRVQRHRAPQRHADGSWRCIEALSVNALQDPLLCSIVVFAHDVSIEQQLHEQLVRRERRFATLTEKSDELIVVLDAHFGISYASASITRVLGHGCDQWTAAKLLRLVHPAHRHEALRSVRVLLAEPRAERRFTSMLRAADGSYRWLELVMTNLASDPDIGGLLINGRDVTQRRDLELELASALESGDLALWDQDLVSREIRWLNDSSMRRMFDNLGAQHRESDYFESVHPDDREHVRQAYMQFEQGQSDRVQVEYRLCKSDGDYRWIIDRARYGGVNPATGARRISGVSIDVTERRTTEDALANARESYLLALDCVQVGFYEYNRERDILTGLTDWSARVGVTIDRMQGTNVSSWLTRMHPDDLPRVRDCFAQNDRVAPAAVVESFVEAEYRIRHDDGTSWVWILHRAKIMTRDSRGQASRVVGVVMNIDWRKRLEFAMGAAQSRLTTAIWGANFGLWEMELPDCRTTWFSDWCRAENIDPCTGVDGLNRWRARVHHDDRARAQTQFNRMLAGEFDSCEAEYRVQTLSGTWRWLFERCRAVSYNANGRPTRVVGICMNIDARKKAEEDLRISEFRYRSVAELTPGYVAEYAFDDAGQARLRWASDGFQKVFGMPPAQQMQPHESLQYFNDDERAAARARMAQLLSGNAASGDTRVLRPDGTMRWLHVAARPLRDATNGNVTGALAVAHDITHRKLAEIELLESQLKLQSLADNSPDWLTLLDGTRRIQFINRPWSGLAAEDLLGKPIEAIATTVEPEPLRRFLDQVYVTGEYCEIEQIASDNAGSSKVILHRARPVQAQGRVIGAVINSSDITQRVRQQNQLRLQAHILETMREGIALLDAANCVRVTNPSFDAMFGQPAGRLVGQPFGTLLPGDDAMRIDRAFQLRQQLADARTVPIEFECQRGDGHLFVVAGLATRTVVGSAEHLLLVISDVTERKVLEREILEVSNREQQRIGADLHDGLGQELTGVALLLRSLATRIERKFPNERAGIDEIIALVNHTIEVTRTLARGLSPVSIERGGLLAALRTMAAGASEVFGIRIALRTRIQSPLRLDEGAANHLHRIVQEALSNAKRHGHARNICINLTSDSQHIRLSIRDDGRGIDKGAVDRGGLGLRTMNYRAQVIGGQLSVKANRHGGTIVRCICPQGARISAKTGGVAIAPAAASAAASGAPAA